MFDTIDPHSILEFPYEIEEITFDEEKRVAADFAFDYIQFKLQKNSLLPKDILQEFWNYIPDNESTMLNPLFYLSIIVLRSLRNKLEHFDCSLYHRLFLYTIDKYKEKI